MVSPRGVANCLTIRVDCRQTGVLGGRLLRCYDKSIKRSLQLFRLLPHNSRLYTVGFLIASPGMNETLQNTQAEIIEGLRETLRKPVTLDGSTHIVRDLQLDSLAVMDFIMSLEDRFDVVIPLDRVAEVETLADLARVVDQLRGRT